HLFPFETETDLYEKFFFIRVLFRKRTDLWTTIIYGFPLSMSCHLFRMRVLFRVCFFCNPKSCGHFHSYRMWIYGNYDLWKSLSMKITTLNQAVSVENEPNDSFILD